jgi:uncharacterized protein YdiU (UPF0061 family)
MDSLDTSPNVQPTTLASSGLEVRFSFDNTYARLPEHFFARLDPTPVALPRLEKLNVELARELGLDATALTSDHGVEVLAGNRVAEGAEPLALAYAGHQFEHFVPQLGDGRANLLVGGTSSIFQQGFTISEAITAVKELVKGVEQIQ